jgi:ribonuclease III
MLYHRFPQYQEGLLSRMRAGLVNEARLADLARDLGLPDALLLGRGEETTGGRDKNSILADAVEAVIAAVYLDGGFDAALIVVRRLWGDLIGSSSHDELLKDFKTRLQEQTQRGRGHTPVYELTGSFGPDHARVFEVALKIDGRTVSAGTGRSKKEAEQNAARTALEQTASGWHDPGGDA